MLNNNNFITIEDLGNAYRKAKVDIFYSSRSCRELLIEYESNLLSNLTNLQNSLNNYHPPQIEKTSWTLIPKGIKYDLAADVISSDINFQWDKILTEDKTAFAELRLMENLNIDFHVFSTLWINKIGQKFEDKLLPSARGNRLRRNKKGNINDFSLGSTVPYLFPYCKWRDDAISTMSDALSKNNSIVAFTADASSFYHKLDVNFMIDKSFLSGINVKLNTEELKFHTFFIQSLNRWAKQTPLKQGLPVGLVASSIIANVALYELDQIIEKEIAPLYYGRYVDDILLVMNNGSQFKNSSDVLQWLSNHSRNSLVWKDDTRLELMYKQPYLHASEIIFKKGKNKIFLLSGKQGKTLLEAIKNEIQERSSEWRSLPSLPEDSFELESQLLSAIQHNGELVDNLRKADKISIRRAHFALKLRDIEAISRLVNNESSTNQRRAFFNASLQYIFVLPTFFDFFTYLPRIIRLSVYNEDFEHLRQMLKGLDTIINKLSECKIKINAVDSYKGKPLGTFLNNLKVIVKEAIESAFPINISREGEKQWKELCNNSFLVYAPQSSKNIIVKNISYLVSDLSHLPLKFNLLPIYLTGLRKQPLPKKQLSRFGLDTAEKLLDIKIIEGVRKANKVFKIPSNNKVPSGLLFPTRPLGIHDLYLVHPDPFSPTGINDISKILLSQRGYMPENKLPGYKKENPNSFIEIPTYNAKDIIKIAITSWMTKEESWVASVTKSHDPDGHRLLRLNNLINDILKSRIRPDYLILPELSIPANWFLSIAGKLRGKHISLICGIEYIHGVKNKVHNQVWASLIHNSLGFIEILIVRQDKQRPALHEEREIYSIAGKNLSQQYKKWTSPPIINHGGFYFSMLICSELTNIDYRSTLRGNIDAVFIPEWNKDTETFNSLVEASAIDIHAFLIQCNNRQYGDSRIRAPYKDNWLRDIVRVKGGIDDYFVIGEISIKDLREFQSHYRSPSGPFKPVPDGFIMSFERKTIPL